MTMRRAFAAGEVDAPLRRRPATRTLGHAVEPLILIVRLAGLGVERRQDARCWSSGNRACRRTAAATARTACRDRASTRSRCVPSMLPFASATRIALRSLPRKPLIEEHHAVVVHRRRNRVHRQAVALPDDLAGLEVVAADALHRRHDHLRAAVHARRRAASPRCRSRRAATRHSSLPSRLSSAMTNDSPLR